MQSITLLGSTGSIGQQVLDIVAAHPQRFSVFALSAYCNGEMLFQQCKRFKPKYAVLVDGNDSAILLSERLKHAALATQVKRGGEALQEIVADSETETVVVAITGAAALLPTMAAIQAGKRLLLANKEALVMAGELVMSAVKTYQTTLLPIDSEHNAILQCLPKGYLPGHVLPANVHSVVLTASGGPFRVLPLDQLGAVTPREAVAHPNWSMGAKISVDSATMMNKGLEVIEAYHLFGIGEQQIEVVIHPQSLVHAFVRYIDGSVSAQISSPDMRIPIAFTMAWPERIASGVKPLDFTKFLKMEFDSPDSRRYPCLNLAYEALRVGGTAPTLLNAANEVAVAAFLAGKIRFNQIFPLISEVMTQLPVTTALSLEEVIFSDQQARHCAMEIMEIRKV